MSIKKRGKVYYCRFTAPNGKEIHRSTGTQERKEAEEFESKLKAELWRTHKLGDKPRRSYMEAVVAYVTHAEIRESTEASMVSNLNLLDPFFNGLMLDEITRDKIDAFKFARLETGVSKSTVNKQLELLRAILRYVCDDLEWIDNHAKVKLFKKSTGRIRYLSAYEYRELFKPGILNDHTRDMALFSLATGIRESNVTGLKWDKVDLVDRVAYIEPSELKTNKWLAVPLNNTAIEVIKKQIGKHSRNVFTYKGKPISKAGTKAWRNSLAKAGIEDFKWHDLRHTWASWHVQSGTSLHELQVLGGWSSMDMVLRYAHLDNSKLKETATSIDAQFRNELIEQKRAKSVPA